VDGKKIDVYELLNKNEHCKDCKMKRNQALFVTLIYYFFVDFRTLIAVF
jgi:hypothetical protein